MKDFEDFCATMPLSSIVDSAREECRAILKDEPLDPEKIGALIGGVSSKLIMETLRAYHNWLQKQL